MKTESELVVWISTPTNFSAELSARRMHTSACSTPRTETPTRDARRRSGQDFDVC